MNGCFWKKAYPWLVIHCVKSARIRSYCGPHFPDNRLNTERYGVSLCIQSECGKVRTRITPNTDTFYVVIASKLLKRFHFTFCHDPYDKMVQIHSKHGDIISPCSKLIEGLENGDTYTLTFTHILLVNFERIFQI